MPENTSLHIHVPYADETPLQAPLVSCDPQAGAGGAVAVVPCVLSAAAAQ
jgi:hypothetical protein